MIISVWRYSHLALAVSSFLLLTVASVTGIFLAFEPVMEKAGNYKTAGMDTLTLAQSIPLLKEKFPGIQELAVDHNYFVVIKYGEEEGGDKLAYVNPATGEILGVPTEKTPLFQWMNTMHRSLFMHETGRVLTGIAAFLLILIAVSGVLLIVQRQNGWRNFFSTVEKTGFAQYYHTVFGRLSLFFILAIALTGTYLAVFRFVPPPAKANLSIDETAIKEEPVQPTPAFHIFQQTLLSDLQKLQYPFSDFPEDYYTLQLNDREICVNQFTGDVLAEVNYSQAYQLAGFSLRWHTGRSGTIWAIILAITSGYILFFIWSGFAIMFKRRRGRSGKKVKAADARIVILVGSENGSTFRFADAVCSQLIKQGEPAFVTDINHYKLFPNAQHLVVMTSTYGQGDAPSNATRLAEKLKKFPQTQHIRCAVVGFGSRSYAHFCKFAFDTASLLQAASWASVILPVHTVDDQSPQDFSDWLTHWTAATGFKIMLPRTLLAPVTKELKTLSVVERTDPDAEAAFTIRFKARKLKQAVSGDLLAIYPRNDHRERLYSIGKINGQIQLSVKLHEHGLGSGFLNALQAGDKMNARLIKNKHFRFPQTAKKIMMISNGTGIAPYLGMISENKKRIPIHLYCGFRNHSSFALYEPFLKEQMGKGKLEEMYVSLSREGEKEYVSHRMLKNGNVVLQAFREGGVMMICGSLSMQQDVMKVLTEIFGNSGNEAVEALVEEGKILTDCY